MSSVNMVVFIGRVGADPTVRYTASGATVCNLSIAASYVTRDQDGSKKEETEWGRVVMFGRLAEIAAQYVKKGALLYVNGRLRTRKWTDQSGQERYTTEIVAQQMQMLGSRDSGAQSSGYAPQQQSQPVQAAQQRNEPFSEADDDIPF